MVDDPQQARRCIGGCSADFDPEKVARFTPKQLAKILLDPGIVRNRQKVAATVSNARAFLKLRDEHGTFDEFLWGFVDGAPIVNRWKRGTQIPPRDKHSDAVAAALKQRGFKFAGTTIMYAHLQACGLVNDHLIDCPRWRDVQR